MLTGVRVDVVTGGEVKLSRLGLQAVILRDHNWPGRVRGPSNAEREKVDCAMEP